jgi:hypothetical protein
MATTSWPKCGAEVGEGEIICPSCDFVLDVSLLHEEAEDADDEDIKPIEEVVFVEDDDDADGEIFDPAAEGDDAGEEDFIPDEGTNLEAGGAEEAPAPSQAEIDAELAAELQSVLDEGTGTFDLGGRHRRGAAGHGPAAHRGRRGEEARSHRRPDGPRRRRHRHRHPPADGRRGELQRLRRRGPHPR